MFYSHYADGSLESRAATPVLYANTLVGAVYLMEYDTDQGGLIFALQFNIFWISLVLECALILFSLVFSEVFSRRCAGFLRLSGSFGRGTTPIK